ncbi:hypothetical protein HYZ78_01895 [Candidatus Microgenomates bacterium]|nr:hypothetical protein [Candidatus Microgenomates bacterium]
MSETPAQPENPIISEQLGDQNANMSVERQQPTIEEAQVARARETAERALAEGAKFSGGAEGDEPDPNQLSPEEREFREAQYSRGRKMVEILNHEREPLVLREAMRNYLSTEERAVYLGPRRASEYVFESVERTMEDRISELKMAYYGSLPIVKEVRVEGQSRDRKFIPVYMEKAEARTLFGEFSRLHDEFLARVAMMDVFNFKQQWAGDVNGFLGMLEARGGARCPQGRQFTLMGRLSETGVDENGEKLKPFGQHVDKALRLWTDLAENKVKGIKNPSGEYFFSDHLQRSIDYVAGQLIGRDIPDNLSEEEKLDLGKKYDDAVNAAVLALGLFKIFDFHLTYSISLDEDGNPGVSVSQLDAAKAAYTGTRQINERNRDHPYNPGLLAAAGVFPNLIKNFFQTVAVKLGSDAGARRVDMWQLWREDGVPLGDLPLDKEKWDERLEYFKRRFPLVNFDTDLKKYEGMYEHAWLVPYKLAHDYARDIFGLIFNSKTKDAMDTIQNPEAMLALNKAFGLGFDITYGTSGMTSRDTEALRQFTKVTYLGEVLVSMVEAGQGTRGPVGKFIDRMKRPLVAKGNIKFHESDLKDTMIWDAAQVSGFVSPEEPVSDSPTQPEDFTRLVREKALYDKVVKERRGFLPHELIGSYFKDEEQVGRIYRSGAYDYNPNVWKIAENSGHKDHDLIMRLMGGRHGMLRERAQAA